MISQVHLLWLESSFSLNVTDWKREHSLVVDDTEFSEGFGWYDAVISAYLNSLTTTIKTKIQLKSSWLVKSCLWALTNKDPEELDTAGSDCVTPTKLTRLKTSLGTKNNIHFSVQYFSEEKWSLKTKTSCVRGKLMTAGLLNRYVKSIFH